MHQSKPLSRFSRAHLAALLVASIASFAGAVQAQTIQTDREHFAQSSEVVGKGRVQIETSVAVARDGSSMERSYMTATPTLLRFGVSNDVELRVATDGFLRYADRESVMQSRSVTKGFGDVALGMKWHAAKQSGLSPSLAVLADATLDSGSAEFRGNGVRPSVALAAEWKLHDGMSVSFMPGVTFDKTADGRSFTSTQLGLTFSKAWTGNFRTSVEYAAPRLAAREYGGDVAYYGFGGAYLLSKNSQLNFAFQHGTTSATPDMAVVVGFSTRF